MPLLTHASTYHMQQPHTPGECTHSSICQQRTTRTISRLLKTSFILAATVTARGPAHSSPHLHGNCQCCCAIAFHDSMTIGCNSCYDSFCEGFVLCCRCYSQGIVGHDLACTCNSSHHGRTRQFLWSVKFYTFKK